MQRDEKTGALAVHDDAAKVEVVVQERDRRADLELASCGGQVVGDGIVGLGERPAGEKRESVAQAVKALIVNPVDDAQVVHVHDDEDGGDFVHSRQPLDLAGQRFGNDGAGKGKENGGVGRLDDDVRADALGAGPPIAQHSGGQSHNQQDQKDLQGDGRRAEA